MNKRTKILLSALASIALCVGVVYAVTNVPPATTDEQPNSNNSSVPADRVEVVYLHFTQRCSTCVHAENMTVYTLETYFADELASRKVTFQSINVDDPKNAEIVAKYGNPSILTLCINTVIDDTDHIEEVTDIWYVSDQEFADILKGDIERSLAGEA
jgi:hypothetical protein